MRSLRDVSAPELRHQPWQNWQDQSDPHDRNHERDEDENRGWFAGCRHFCRQRIAIVRALASAL
jgi:hypothetical protein